MQIFADKQFENPIEIITAFDNQSFIEAFLRIEILRETHYLLGYVRYEAKDIFLGKDVQSDLPLLYFEVFKEAKNFQGLCSCEEAGTIDAAIQKKYPLIDFKTYSNSISQIKKEIVLGNTYEVNYTYDWQVETDVEGFRLFNSLLPMQKTPYNAYIKNDYEEILSFSPELFFELEGNKIKTKPMKGTIKRGESEEDDRKNIGFLKNDPKNRAENVMIVDLLRNDLGRIAKTGTVKVGKLFDIETHSTLHQMTSEISAELEKNTTLFEIFEAIFPCGSITGAPKISTMEIIEKIEKGSRGVYCGAIGLITPEKTVFSVPIRILQRKCDFDKSEVCHCEEWQSHDAAIQKENTGLLHFVRNDTYNYIYRVGGAIVWDSTAEDEWQETQTKIKFLQNRHSGGKTRRISKMLRLKPQHDATNRQGGWTCQTNNIQLVETMLIRNKEIQDLDLHLARMENSSKELGFEFDKEKVLEKVGWAFQPNNKLIGNKILRLLLNKNGKIKSQISPYNELKTNQVIISKTPVNSQEKLLYHKTTHRPWYEKSMERIKNVEIFDEIFFNERGELTEGARSNIILQIGEEFFTPPVKCGLLNGIMRRKLIRKNISPNLSSRNCLEIYPIDNAGKMLNQVPHDVIEKVLYLDDLKNAEKVFCINSVRGIVEVNLSPRPNAKKVMARREHDFN